MTHYIGNKQHKYLPSISIITPSFNQGSFIKQTIDSILDQQYPHLELIVMDGGSTDGTVDILKSYGDRIWWVSEKDKGQSDAINRGLRRAKGDIVAWLNSDDYYLPGTLHTVGKYFADQTTCDWLSGGYVIVNTDDHPIQSYVVTYKNLLKKLPIRLSLLLSNSIIQPATFWRRSLIEQTGYLDESLRYVMDYDLWMRFLAVSEPHLLPDILCAFRIHALSKGGSQYTKQFREESKLLDRYISNPVVRWLHVLHNEAIILAYRLIK